MSKLCLRWSFASTCIAILTSTVCSSARAADDGQLEAALVDSMRLDKTESVKRMGDSGAAIRGYIAAGYLAKRPNARLDYSDYWWLKTHAPFMGHELVMIEQEYMSSWVGCCVSPGVGVTMRVNGSTANLEKFAQANKCSVDTNANLQDVAKFSHVALSSLPKGRYATMSCRERDIELQEDKK